MPIPEYVKSIRQHIGADKMFMPCTAACICDEAGRILLIRRSDITYPSGDQTQLINLCFECRAVGGALRPDGEESLEVAYFAPDDLPTVRPCCVAKARDAAANRPEAFFR